MIVLMITLTSLQKVIDQTRVIDIPSLAVKAGEVIAVIGPVGCGRHVLLQLLTGDMRPTTGSVRLAGLDPHREREAFSRQVGILFPDDNLYKRMSVIGNLHFYCRLYRLSKTRGVEVLEQIGLADHAHVGAEKLSAGPGARAKRGLSGNGTLAVLSATAV